LGNWTFSGMPVAYENRGRLATDLTNLRQQEINSKEGETENTSQENGRSLGDKKQQG
jgi:hypothetical protein